MLPKKCSVKSCLILFAHGSRDPEWQKPFVNLERTLQNELGSEVLQLCYLEFIKPSLMDVCENVVSFGIGRVKILPLFMSCGGHVDQGIPRLMEKVKQRFPHLEVEYLPPIGEHPSFINLIRTLAKDAAREESNEI